MAQHIWLVRVAAVVGSLIGGVPALAQVPPEFHGVWSWHYGEKVKCTKKDEGGNIFKVNRGGSVGYEDFCKILKFESHKREGEDSNSAEKTGTVELSCGEGGGLWRSKAIWHVRTVNGQKILVMTTFQKTAEKNEDDKTPFGSYKPHAYVSLSYECK